MLLTHPRLLYAHYALRYLSHTLGHWWDPAPQKWNSLLPNAFILGGKRCGTRQLKTLLIQHPAVYAPQDKNQDEIRFFDRWQNAESFSQLCMAPIFGLNKVDKATMGAIHYLMLYAKGIRNSQLCRYPIRLDKSVNYLFFPHCAAAIHKLIPDAKLIVLLREPIRRAVSDYYFNRRRISDYEPTLGYPSARTPTPDVIESIHETRSIGEAFQQEDERVAPALYALQQGRLLSPRHYDILRLFAYHQRGLYAKQLQRYTQLFTPQQILIIRSENLFADPMQTTRRALEFLGLNASEAVAFRRKNAQGDKNPTPYKKDANMRLATQALQDYYAKPNKDLEALLRHRRNLGSVNDIWSEGKRK